ncbi:hypothetical protein [Janthinobacterium sp. PAMC25594]|uniref:hypothetical protein n=1 Tax=Janthinobacterium sp. PAMC25594 TaxID=2861284 RepID=UPI001C632B83|nr:hypothetical protein [Janthinobacterium sp. PAMC25594]QYG08048.1 hypothetical protein KY494_04410 [Janthinobacterium sp. PAMC25594]
MPDIAQLGLSIDTRQVVEGSKALDSLGEAAVRVEQKTAGATAAVDKLGEANAAAKAKVTESAAAVDAVGEAGVRAAQKVAGTTTSVDSLSAAAVRVRSTSVEGASALDGFTNASAGVWRRGGDAARSVETLGDATQRTGQRAAVSNGQMDDTSKIMRAQAEQARQAAQATTALGGSTTQLTLGQQQLIERMREQAATIGMSRTQLLAYQAAQMGVTQETQRAIATIKAHEDAIKAAAKAKEDAARSSGVLADAVKMLVAAYAALKVWDYVKESALLAARYETLGVVMEVVGRNAGYTKTQMITATEAIAAQGITMIESRESAVKLVQAHIDLKHATGLARIAQDAAVIGHMNSSEAFDRLVNGISRGNVLILRNIGINVNLQAAYRDMADALGKTTKELTENERVEARRIAVFERGVDINGTYAASMDTAGKQITSMQRYVTDLKTRFGETFNEVLTISVMALTRSLKDANGEVSELAKNNQLEDWGHNLAATFVWIANTVSNANTVLQKAWAWANWKQRDDAVREDFHKKLIDNNADGSINNDERRRRAIRIESVAKSEFAQEYADYVAGQAKLTSEFDRFSKAEEERNAARTTKRKAEADARLKVEADYSKAASEILMKSLNQGAVAQEEARKKVVALHYATFTGTPSYRDTEGREPKPKADQVENTQLADQIKQYEKEAATAKAHYDALGKLDDMYLRGGELSVQQAYENKRSYATKTYEAQIDAYDLELDALSSHNSHTSGEAAKHEKQINEILGKRDAAEKAFFDESFRRDEEERLRQAAIATAASDAANKEIAAINAQVAAVEEQIRTYGLLPAQKTALAVADLEEQKAALVSFEGNEKIIDGINRKIDALKRLGIVQGKASTQEQGGDVAKAKELLDILTAVDTATKSAAQGMAASFGAVGTAIGGLTTALSGYAVQQQAIAAQLAAATKDAYGDPTKVAKAQAAAAQQGAQAQIKSYGDMASAAKGFFKENSTGYKVMETAEKAFRAYEMAMAVESMVKKIFFKEAEVAANLTLNATKLTGEATTTAASTGLAATEASAWGITAVVKALASLPFPLNLAAGAATLAAVVAIGAKMLGGTGGSSVSLSQQRQASNGTGSVLGDSSAKSESIAHSLAIMEKNSGLGLAYSASMASSLRQVVDGIGGLGGLLVRNSGVTGSMAADTKGGAASFGASTLGVALTGGVIGLTLDKLTGGLVGKITGGILGSIFGGKTTTLDTGVMLNKASLTSIQMGGVSASQYTDTKTSGGWFSRDKNRTALSSLGGEANDQFTKIILGLRDTIQSSATALGMGGAVFTAQLNTFVVDLGKISLKNLKGDELQKALETAFSKLGDDMAKFGLGGLEQYQAVGEGYLETLARVANDYMQVSDVLAVLGKSFNTTGLGAVALSESLITAAGGLETLTSGTSYFVENFLTEAERMAPITKSVNDAMGKLGISGVDTVDQFKALVLAQDLNTAAGQAMYVGLIGLAEPFKKAADYAAELAGATGDLAAANKTASEIASERRDLQQQLNELTKSETALLAIQRAGIADVNKALFDQVQVEKAAAAARDAAAKTLVTAKDALTSAYQAESSAAQSALDKVKNWVSSLNSMSAGLALGNLSTLTPEQKYAEARAQFEKTLAAARGGDAEAQSGLSAAEQAFLTASQLVNASSTKYAADYALVQAANAEALKYAAAQVNMQQASLDALKAQVSGLITVNASVLTVAQAIDGLRAAMGVATRLGVPFDGSHAGGLVSVPFNGYAAELHQGEMVVDAAAAAAMRRYFGGAPSQGGGNTDALVAEIRALREENKATREELRGLRADQAKQTGDIILGNYDASDKAANKQVAGAKSAAMAPVYAEKMRAKLA